MKAILRTVFLAFARLSKRFSRENLYKWLAEDPEILPQGSKVLSIGGGGALDTMITGNSAIEAIAIDIDPDRKPDIVMDATDMSFDDGTFDAVYMMGRCSSTSKTLRQRSAKCGGCSRTGGASCSVRPSCSAFTKNHGISGASHGTGWSICWPITKSGRSGRAITITALSSCCSCARSFPRGRKRQLVGGIAIVLGLLFFLVLMLLDVLSPDDRSTSGYFVTCRKPLSGGGA